MSASTHKPAKRNWSQEVSRVLAQIFVDHAAEEMTLGDVYKYALATRRIPAEYIEGVHEKALKREFGRILRTARLHTSEGIDARQYQSYVRFTQDDDGNEVQQHFWKDIRQMDRREMVAAAMDRKSHITDSLESLEADVEYWNRNVRKPGERKIQLTLPGV